MNGEVARGRRAADAAAAQQGVAIAEHSLLIKLQGEEIDKMRTFKHDVNNIVQKLALDVEGLVSDMKIVVGISDRVTQNESDHRAHTVECNMLRKGLEQYMKDSAEQRTAIQTQQTSIIDKMNTKDTKALIYALGVAVAIIGALLWRFGLPPMGN